MDVNKRITALMEQKGLTYYKLAKLSGLSQSTLSNMYIRNTVPTIYTLKQICRGLGISLSTFFMENGESCYYLTPLQAELLQWAALLSEEKQVLILEVVKEMV